MNRRDGSLDDFKARLPLGDIVARHVKLVRKGRELVGLCPFHKEKTPSFAVVEEKGFYHCFGCGAHGNAIDFVMTIERLEFREALDRLAELTGIEAPSMRGDAAPRVERGLYDALASATLVFERHLAGPGGAAARSYLTRRGIDATATAGFRLGWAPSDRLALKTELLAAGFEERLLVEAGLLVRPDDGRASFDRFRERVIFPIGDARGRIVGFGGRTLGDAKPKYLNSPETPVFHKGRLLYNQAAAAPAARTARTVLVAEGYLDVMALAAAGLPHAVAPLGTAVSEEQLQLLWRLADEPVLCLDGDPAGLHAAARAAERALPLLEPGRSLCFALLPPGHDPDSLWRSQGPAALRAALERPLPLLDFIWRRAMAGGVPETPERRAALVGDLRQLVRGIAHAEVRSQYLAAIEGRLDAAGLGRRYRPAGRDRPNARAAGPIAPTAETRARQTDRDRDRRRLRAVLLQPQLLNEYEEVLAAIGALSPDLGEICGEILAWYGQASDLDGAALLTHLRRYGFELLVEHILEDRPWVRGTLAHGVDGLTLEGPDCPNGTEAGAPDATLAQPRESEDASASRFDLLYRILRATRDDDGDSAGQGGSISS